ncbi:hypothetical protein V1477_015108 [Vespula maculifrons]|uniref:Uncharacterized protein n=1 Tax=Vespula maculifrons TaxID=7453 RepID=A0ABD2BJB2_VESMC
MRFSCLARLNDDNVCVFLNQGRVEEEGEEEEGEEEVEEVEEEIEKEEDGAVDREPLENTSKVLGSAIDQLRTNAGSEQFIIHTYTILYMEFTLHGRITPIMTTSYFDEATTRHDQNHLKLVLLEMELRCFIDGTTK